MTESGRSKTRHQFPRLLLLKVALAVVLGWRRSLGEDSAGGLRGAGVPWAALDTRYLPAEGAFVLVGNHYERPGLWTGWGAMVVSVAVRERTGRDLHWLMVSELLDFSVGPLRVPRPLLRWVFARFGRIYGFGLVSAREAEGVGGVAGLRTAARVLVAGEPLGVLPEGTASFALRKARPGVGEALAWLAKGTYPIVPAGLAEWDGVLTATFGPPFALRPIEGTKTERDQALRDQVMVAIGRLLPEDLWGDYRELVRN